MSMLQRVPFERGMSMARIGEVSDLHLAAVIAVATLLGGVGTSLVNAYILDAKTERESDIRLLELAIGVLGEPAPATTGFSEPDRAMRSWAFDTMNAVSDVKFDIELRHALVEGKTSLSQWNASKQLALYIHLARAGHRGVLWRMGVPQELIDELMEAFPPEPQTPVTDAPE